MPELPEVETVRRFLESVLLKGKAKKIKSIKAFYPGIIKHDAVAFINTLVGQSFTQIDRVGKFLILKLQTHSIISHLRMEGKYIWYDKKYVPEKHDHIQFLLNDGNSIVYNDVRKFGTMHLVKKGQERAHPSIAKLGPEVNDPTTFTPAYFYKVASTNISKIKEVLLKQEIVCGIGNIYADEILFAARVHPETKCYQLGEQKVQRIVEVGKEIIDRAIDGKGTTFRSFSSNHQAGNFQNMLAVYDQDGKPCQSCGSIIRKIKVGGRGTHFCPICQQ